MPALAAAALALVCAAPLLAQAIRAGEWASTATVREIELPGAPGFLTRMVKGKTKTERKCVTAQEAARGIDALLAPEPKSNCTVLRYHAADGRFSQSLRCRRKDGAPFDIDRQGSYAVDGVQSRIVVSGTVRDRPMRMVIDHQTRPTGKACRR